MDMEAIARKFADHGSRLKNLENYQDKQNGSLQRVENRVEHIEDKLDAFKMWFIGFMGSTILILVGFLIKG